MSDRLKYERFQWFHGKTKNGRFPNATHLARHFEISGRTAQRDIEFMRERLLAPLLFNHYRKGYQYTDDTYELPGHLFSQTTIYALALAVRLASTIPDHAFKEELCDLINRVTRQTANKEKSCIDRVKDKISVKNIEYSRVDDWCFRLTVQALFDESALCLRYSSPHTGKQSTRIVQPLHLLHYMGSWHLFAWCTKRNQIRDFVLSRIKEVEPAAQKLCLPSELPSLREYTRRFYGIMQGDEMQEVILLFSPESAAWLAEQIWHPAQEMTRQTDGSLLLRFPAADFRELVKRILGHGAEVRVIAPTQLQELVREEIKKMTKIYGV